MILKQIKAKYFIVFGAAIFVLALIITAIIFGARLKNKAVDKNKNQGINQNFLDEIKKAQEAQASRAKNMPETESSVVDQNFLAITKQMEDLKNSRMKEGEKLNAEPVVNQNFLDAINKQKEEIKKVNPNITDEELDAILNSEDNIPEN